MYPSNEFINEWNETLQPASQGHTGQLPYPDVGAVIAWAGCGELSSDIGKLCDGRAVSMIDYPALFEAMGTTYGTGDSPASFSLPRRDAMASEIGLMFRVE